MEQETKDLFKTLTELAGPPGFEHDVRRFMRQELEKYSDEVIQDRLGGVFGVRKGEGPRVMVAGHMDEVGFMVTQINEERNASFSAVRWLVEPGHACTTCSNHDG